jgi:fatty-acyl-CoA synthase
VELHRRPTYPDLIDLALRRFPERTAFVSNGRRWTYAETRDRISQYAQALNALGLGRGDKLTLLSPNRPEIFAVMAAALCRGVVYAPLHPLGGVEDHAFICDDAEAALLVYDPSAFAEEAAELASFLPRIASFGPGTAGDDLNALADRFDPVPLEWECREADLALLMYTGGTTGRPKGVMQPHRSIVTNVMLALAEWQLGETPVFLGCAPLSHGLLHMVLPVLLRGGTLVLQPGFEPDAVLDAIAEERVTSSFWVPTMIYALLDHPRTRDADLSSLETIVYGAAPISPTRLQEALEVFGRVFLQVYAQTEAPNTAVVLRREQHDADHLLAAGKPLAGVEVRILDPEDREVPRGQTGELCIRGPIVMDGYWQRPEQTAETLRNGWLHTGDVAHMDDDDFVYLVDRTKEMIVTGAFNVFPREVEDVLARHGDVASVAVIGVPDERWGEAVKAVVVRRNNVSDEELIAFVKDQKGPVYAPKSVDFVDALPVTPVGKIDKPALRARYWAGETRGVH